MPQNSMRSFAVLAALSSALGLISAQNVDYGSLFVSSYNVNVGDTITVTYNATFADIRPDYVDIYLQGVMGPEQVTGEALLLHSAFPADKGALVFDATVPNVYNVWDTNYTSDWTINVGIWTPKDGVVQYARLSNGFITINKD